VIVRPFDTTRTAPCSAVFHTEAPPLRRRHTTAGAGKPKRLSRPLEMIAIRGATAASHEAVDDVALP
jgi:hypothetical protein